MKYVRILIRNIRDGFKNVFRNFSLALASVSCITVTLIVVAIAVIGSINVENFANVIRDDFTIVVYMENDLKEEDEKKISEEIKTISNVESIDYSSKKEIAEQMKKEDKIFDTIISSWSDSENPLYDTYKVKVKDSEKISNVAKKIQKKKCVGDGKYGAAVT